MNKRDGIILGTIEVSSGNRSVLAFSPRDIIFFDHNDESRESLEFFKNLSKVLVWRATD